MTDQDKQKVIAKIRALMAKTTAAGATEDEAMGAAAKAAELMDKYEISFAEIQQQNAGGFIWNKMTPKQRWLAEFYSWIGAAIASYTGTVATTVHGGGRINTDTRMRSISGIGYAGEKGDVLFAEWLTSAVGDFVHTGYREELRKANRAVAQAHTLDPRRWPKRKLTGKALAKYRSGYLMGAAYTISARLNTLADERAAAQTQANALTIISKAQMALIKLRQEQGDLDSTKHRNVEIDQGAVYAGIVRGKAAQFHKPVGQSGALVIGKS